MLQQAEVGGGRVSCTTLAASLGWEAARAQLALDKMVGMAVLYSIAHHFTVLGWSGTAVAGQPGGAGAGVLGTQYLYLPAGCLETTVYCDISVNTVNVFIKLFIFDPRLNYRCYVG